MLTAREYNFDGLVGPSHNYAGLSFGNVASFSNVRSASNPRQAALQGLAKMRALSARGFAQAVMPPQARPNFRLLRRVGFSGTDADVLARAFREAPVILACAYSAAPMWTANAATVSPSSDTADGRVHFTAANLNNKLHRSEEHVQATRTLRAIFKDSSRFVVHDALPPVPAFGDEGAANHTRFAAAHGAAGVEFFVYSNYSQTTRHNRVRDTLAAVARSFGISATIEPTIYTYDSASHKRPDIVFYLPRAVATDVSVVHPSGAEGESTRAKAKEKTRIHEAAVKAANHDFIPFVLDTYGVQDRCCKELIESLKKYVPIHLKAPFEFHAYLSISCALAKARAATVLAVKRA